MIILGIDPGTALTGYGVVEAVKKNGTVKLKYVDHGCIETSKEMEMSLRLLKLYRDFLEKIARYKPECVAVEQLFFGMNRKTAITVSQARGVVILASAEKKIPFYEYQGLKVKRGITGYGRSKKKEIQEKVAEILCLTEIPKPDDAADGLAMAIYHGMNGAYG